MNGFKDDMIWYTNFSIDPDGWNYIRKAYNFSDVCREVGGIISLGLTCGHIMVMLFNYYKLELKLLKNHNKMFPSDDMIYSGDQGFIPMGLKLLFYEIFKKCRYKNSKLDQINKNVYHAAFHDFDLNQILRIGANYKGQQKLKERVKSLEDK